jgi:hypothetical protein
VKSVVDVNGVRTAQARTAVEAREMEDGDLVESGRTVPVMMLRRDAVDSACVAYYRQQAENDDQAET